jgi:hypothetical protein
VPSDGFVERFDLALSLAAFELHPVWTVIVRSDREAQARTTGGSASLGGVGFPWPWAVLAWAALLVAIAVSFRPAVPIIWGDTPSFVESALRTLEAGRPTVAGGRDPGYPAFLAMTFAFGGGLRTVVYLQQAAWAFLMLALAATAQAATRNAGGLVPIILVATYPGLLLFRNVLTAELPFAVFLNLAVAGLLVATCVGKTARCFAVAASVVCAALAGASDRREFWSRSSPSWWAPTSPGRTRPRALP